MEDYNVTPESIDNTYSRGTLTPPTTFHSIYRSGQGGFITGYKWIGDLYNKAFGVPENQGLKDTLQMIQQERNVEGQEWTQKSANWIADMVGYAVNPVVIGLTTVGGGIGGLAATGLGKVAPRAAIPFLEKVVGSVKDPVTKELIPLTIGDIGKKTLISATAGTASGIPMAFEEGSAKDALMMGGMGILFGSIPIAHGLLRGKKSLTPKESKFIESYENKSEPLSELKKQASSILKDEGHDVDSVSHEISVNILNEKNIKNIQSSISDSISADISNKNYLTDYLVKNGIDELRQNPKTIDVLKSYDRFIGEKLLEKEQILKKADELHESNMSKKLNKSSILSQQEIHKAIKNLSKEQGHYSQLPFTLPSNLKKYMRIQEKIKFLKKSGIDGERISRWEKLLPEVLDPKKELSHLKEKLLDNKGYKNKTSNEYQRLFELSNHWPQAKSLLYRIKLEESFEKQETIKSFLDKIRSVLESPVGKLADPSKAEQYVRERIESNNVRKFEESKTPDQKISESSKVPSDIDKVLNEQENYVSEMNVENLGKDFEEDINRIKQFKSNDSALNELIQCIMGTTNA